MEIIIMENYWKKFENRLFEVKKSEWQFRRILCDHELELYTWTNIQKISENIKNVQLKYIVTYPI